MNRAILVLGFVAFLPQSFSSDKDAKKERSFLEIYKADAKKMVLRNTSEPDVVREYRELCIKCCAGQIPKEDCSDFNESWGTNKNCGWTGNSSKLGCCME